MVPVLCVADCCCLWFGVVVSCAVVGGVLFVFVGWWLALLWLLCGGCRRLCVMWWLVCGNCCLLLVVVRC